MLLTLTNRGQLVSTMAQLRITIKNNFRSNLIQWTWQKKLTPTENLQCSTTIKTPTSTSHLLTLSTWRWRRASCETIIKRGEYCMTSIFSRLKNLLNFIKSTLRTLLIRRISINRAKNCHGSRNLLKNRIKKGQACLSKVSRNLNKNRTILTLNMRSLKMSSPWRNFPIRKLH